MTYYCFTYSGEGYPVFERLQREGNFVAVGLIKDKKDTLLDNEIEHFTDEDTEKKKRRLQLYKNILKRYPARELVQYLKGLPKSKRSNIYILNDFNHNFKFAEQLMDLGYNGNFPTKKDRKFEEDREFAKNFVKDFYPDVKVAEEHKFDKVADAISFLKDTQELWVLKGFDDEAKTIVPDKEDPELAKIQLIQALTEDKKDYEKSGFLIELKIPDIIEITPEIHFYDGEFVTATVDIENKQIGSGNESFMTGCGADLVFPLSPDSKLFKMAFPDVVTSLAKKHKGHFVWDLSILFDKKTNVPYMGEFCSNRFGYNAFITELAMLDRVSDFFEGMVAKKDPFKKAIGTFASSTRLFDFDKSSKDLMPVAGKKMTWSDEAYSSLWLWDVKRDGEDYVTVGSCFDNRFSDIGVITGTGKTIESSAKKMFENVKGFNFEGIYNRPYFDYVSKDYPTSIQNRYQYLLDKKLL